MERGDIGDPGLSRIPRVVLVWEGVCAAPPEERVSFKDRYKSMINRQVDWGRIVRSWEIFDAPLQRIYALYVRGVPVDIVTFLGEEYCDALRDHLDRLLVAVSRVETFESAEHLARSLRISPEIQYVVDSDPERLKHYGRRGMAVTRGDDWGMII